MVETLPNEPRHGWSINCRSAIELSHRDEIIGSLSSSLPLSSLLSPMRDRAWRMPSVRRSGLHWLCVDGYWQIPQPENGHKVVACMNDIITEPLGRFTHARYQRNNAVGQAARENQRKSLVVQNIGISFSFLSFSVFLRQSAIVPPPPDSRNHLGHQDIHSGNEYGEDCQEVLFFAEPIPNRNSAQSKVA